MEMGPAQMEYLYFRSVLIKLGQVQWLNILCNVIIVPLYLPITCYIGYKVIRVAMMGHVRRMELWLMSFAFLEIIGMQIFPTIFNIYYAFFEDEKVIGTTQFDCLFYLYFVHYMPAFLFNIATFTFSFLYFFDCRKRRRTLCCVRLSHWNIGTAYVWLTTCSLLDVCFVFCISWCSIVETRKFMPYKYKCFILLNPIFEKVNAVQIMRFLEWQTELFTHSVPYMLCVAYILFMNYRIYLRYCERRKGMIELGEKNRYGGCVLVLSITALFMAVESVVAYYTDHVEMGQYTNNSLHAEEVFTLRTLKMILRTFYHILSPFQMLAFFSLMPHFQSTMRRYLNDGTTKFDITTVKTIGGDIKTTVHYPLLPERLLTWQGRFYEKFLRCAFCLKRWNKLVDYMETRRRELRIKERQVVANLKLRKEKRMPTYAAVRYEVKKERVTLRRNEVTIVIQPPTPEAGTPEIEVLPEVEPEPEPEPVFKRRHVMFHGRTYEVMESTV